MMSQLRPSSGNSYRRIQGSPLIHDPQTIVQALTSFFPQLSVSPNDVVNPTCDKVCEIYHHIAVKVMKISAPTFLLPPLDAMPTSGCESELFTGVTPKLVIFRAICALLEDLSGNVLPEFGMNDLLLPNAKSTRLFLSALVDFLEFSEKANKEVEQAFSVHDEKKARLNDLKREISDKESEMEKLRVDVNGRKQAANNIREQLNQVKQSADELNSETGGMNEQYKVDEAEVKDLKAKLESHNEELAALSVKSEVASLEGQFRLLKEKLDMKRRESTDLQDKRRSRVAADRTIKQLSEEITGLDVYKEELAQKVDLLSSLRGLVKRVQNEVQSVEGLIKKEEDKASVSEIQFQHALEQHQRDLANIQEQLGLAENVANGLRQRMANVDKENFIVQNEISVIRDQMASSMRRLEAKTQKLSYWLQAVLRQKEGERAAYKQERDAFMQIVSLKNDVLDFEVSESSDTFSLPSRNNRSLHASVMSEL